MQTLSYWVIQEMIAAKILSLKEAKEQSVKFRPITSLELFVPYGKLVFTIVLTATDGQSTITLNTKIKLNEFFKMFQNRSIETTTIFSS